MSRKGLSMQEFTHWSGFSVKPASRLLHASANVIYATFLRLFQTSARSNVRPRLPALTSAALSLLLLGDGVTQMLADVCDPLGRSPETLLNLPRLSA